MSQVNLTNVFFEATSTVNTSSINEQRISSINSNQSQAFKQNLSKAKENISKSNNNNTKINRNESSKPKQNETPVKNSIDSQDDKVINKKQLIEDKSRSAQESNNKISCEEDKETDTKYIMDNQILVLVSQALQLPIEEIQGQLEALGLQIEDLLTEEGFGQFINELFADGDLGALLSGDIDIKNISNLFEQLKSFSEEMKNILGEDKLQLPIKKVNTPETEMRPEEQVLVKQDEMNVDEAILEETVSTQQMIQSDDDSQFKGEEHYLSFMETVEGDSDLGITVPIHNFTKTTFTQAFETEAGVVTQTTTRQIVNGKAFIEQIDFKVLSQTKELNLSLSPKELGQMNIKIIEHNGVMVAEIKVDNEKAKTFIMNDLNTLKDSLEEQGLNVAEVKVDIRQDNHQAQMEQERQKSSKRIQEIISRHLNEEDSIEEEVEIPISSESEIDYMV